MEIARRLLNLAPLMCAISFPVEENIFIIEWKPAHVLAQKTSRVLESQFEMEVQKVMMGENQKQVPEG